MLLSNGTPGRGCQKGAGSKDLCWKQVTARQRLTLCFSWCLAGAAVPQQPPQLRAPEQERFAVSQVRSRFSK